MLSISSRAIWTKRSASNKKQRGECKAQLQREPNHWKRLFAFLPFCLENGAWQKWAHKCHNHTHTATNGYTCICLLELEIYLQVSSFLTLLLSAILSKQQSCANSFNLTAQSSHAFPPYRNETPNPNPNPMPNPKPIHPSIHPSIPPSSREAVA